MPKRERKINDYLPKGCFWLIDLVTNGVQGLMVKCVCVFKA